jgi:anti-anti-sigma factor
VVHEARPPHPAGSITVTHQDGRRVVSLVGEIDLAVVQEFEQTTTAADGRTPGPSGSGGVTTVFDLSAVTFINSAGLGFLIRHQQHAQRTGQRSLLREPPRPVERVLRMMGVDTLFEDP